MDYLAVRRERITDTVIEFLVGSLFVGAFYLLGVSGDSYTESLVAKFGHGDPMWLQFVRVALPYTLLIIGMVMLVVGARDLAKLIPLYKLVIYGITGIATFFVAIFMGLSIAQGMTHYDKTVPPTEQVIHDEDALEKSRNSIGT